MTGLGASRGDGFHDGSRDGSGVAREKGERVARDGSTSLFKLPNYPAWFGADTFLLAGSAVHWIVIAVLAYELSGSVTVAGWFSTARAVMSVITQVTGGTFIDRHDHRTLILVQAGSCSLIWTIMGILFVAGQLTFPLFAGLCLSSSAIFGFLGGTTNAALIRVVGPERYAQAESLNQGRDAAVNTAGSPLGATLFGINQAFPFFASAACDAIAFVSALFLKLPEIEPSVEGRGTSDAGADEGDGDTGAAGAGDGDAGVAVVGAANAGAAVAGAASAAAAGAGDGDADASDTIPADAVGVGATAAYAASSDAAQTNATHPEATSADATPADAGAAAAGEGDAQAKGFFADLIDGWRWVFASRTIVSAVLIIGLNQFASWALHQAVNLSLVEMGTDPLLISLSNVGMAAGTMIGSYVSMRICDRVPVGHGVAAILALTAMAYLPMAIWQGYPVILLSTFLAALPSPLFMALGSGFVFSKTPVDKQGRTRAAVMTAIMAFGSVSGALAGELLPRIGFSGFVLVMIALMGCAALLAAANPRLRTIPASPEWDTVDL